MAGIIFDLDGTLIDSIADIGAAADRVLSQRGLPGHSVAGYRRMLGNGVRELLRRALPPDYPELDEVVKEFRADYWDHLVVDTRLFGGIPELLAAAREAGHPISVLSNKPHEFTARIGDLLFEEADFTEFWGHRDGYARKPDPTSALELAEAMGVAAAETFFIGDSAVDMNTALAAGMHPVGVSWGYQHRNALLDAGAEHVLDDPKDLLDLVSR